MFCIWIIFNMMDEGERKPAPFSLLVCSVIYLLERKIPSLVYTSAFLVPIPPWLKKNDAAQNTCPEWQAPPHQ